MKPPIEWTEDDILQLISLKTNKSSDLEYKQCGALRTVGNVFDRKTERYKLRPKPQKRGHIITEISKDVSSFANAAGGTIIYGVIDDNHIPREIDKYPFDPNELSKEWLENVIDSNIRRKIDGVNINQIELTTLNPGKVIYAVHVPQSLQGAHQAIDYCYYQRRNFKVEPMEDYQVRDVMNRFNFPVLQAQTDFVKLKKDSDEHQHQYAFGLSLINIGNVTAVNFGVDILFPEVFSPVVTARSFLSENEEFSEGRLADREYNFKKACYRNFGSNYVLFPSEEFPVFVSSRTNRITYSINSKNLKYCHSEKLSIRWTLFADNMPPKTGETDVYEAF